MKFVIALIVAFFVFLGTTASLADIILLSVQVSDTESPASKLTLSVTSSNTNLLSSVSYTNLSLDGSERQIKFINKSTGTSKILITCCDNGLLADGSVGEFQCTNVSVTVKFQSPIPIYRTPQFVAFIAPTNATYQVMYKPTMNTPGWILWQEVTLNAGQIAQFPDNGELQNIILYIRQKYL